MDYLNNNQLNDEKIVEDLQRAAEMYENGEIAEVKGMLLDIINAIDEWEIEEGFDE